MGCGEVSLGHNAYPTSNFKPKGLDLFAVEIIIKLADTYVKYLMLTFFHKPKMSAQQASHREAFI